MLKANSENLGEATLRALRSYWGKTAWVEAL